MVKSNIKLIVFDAYGVVLNGGYPTTMKALAKKFNRSYDELYAIFYKKYFNMATENKIDEIESWKKPIEELNLPTDWQEVYEIHFSNIKINKSVINFAAKLRKNYQVVMLSKNTKMQFEEALKRFELKKYFDDVLNTQDWNTTKTEPKAYEIVIEKFGVKPEEIIYIDDMEIHTEVAKKVGLNTIHYKNFKQFNKEMEALL